MFDIFNMLKKDENTNVKQVTRETIKIGRAHV